MTIRRDILRGGGAYTALLGKLNDTLAGLRSSDSFVRTVRLLITLLYRSSSRLQGDRFSVWLWGVHEIPMEIPLYKGPAHVHHVHSDDEHRDLETLWFYFTNQEPRSKRNRSTHHRGSQ